MICEVDERQDAAIGGEAGDGLPGRLIRVDAGRIVAAGVQDDDVAGVRRREGVEHAVRVEPLVRTEVRIRAGLESGRPEDLGMVRPRRRRQPDSRRRSDAGDEVSRHAERPCAAGRVERLDAPCRNRRVAGPEYQVPDWLEIGGVAGDRLVELGGLGFEDPPLRLGDRCEDRRDAGLVDVDAGREADLGGSRVGDIGLGEAEDRVGGQRREAGRECEWSSARW